MTAANPLPPRGPADPAQDTAHRASGPQALVRTDLRKVPVDLLGPMGWVSGLLHVPVHQTLLEYLTLSPRLLKLTRVRLPREPDPRPFVALLRDAITLVAPGFNDEVDKPRDVGFTGLRMVACLLPTAVLRGSLAVALNMRLSDHLQQQGPLLTLHHALLTPYGATAKSPDARSFGTVIVNLEGVLGISDET